MWRALAASVTNLEELQLSTECCTLVTTGEWRLPRLHKLVLRGNFQTGVATALQCLKTWPSLYSVTVHSESLFLSLEPEVPQFSECLEALFIHCAARAGDVSVHVRHAPTDWMTHLASLARTYPWAAISVVESLL